MVDLHRQVEGSEARITKGGKTFEILVDSETAFKYKQGKADLNDALIIEGVFSNARKGEISPSEDLEEAFGTTDTREVAKIILDKGTINMSAEHRNKLTEQKKKRIIDIIKTRAYNPKDNLPIPAARIENAFEELKIKIDMFKNPEEQAKEIVEEISKIMPISMKSLTIALHIPSRYAGKAYNALQNFGRIAKQEWQNNGSIIIHIELPAGRKQDLISKANELTHGDLDIQEVS